MILKVNSFARAGIEMEKTLENGKPTSNIIS